MVNLKCFRYVRTTRVNTMGQLVDYQKKCTEIWNRQVDALSQTEDDVVESDEDEELVSSISLMCSCKFTRPLNVHILTIG
jgi:hypothetical protein